MEKLKILMLGVLIFLILASPALADRGMIPLTPSILEESEQNAIIAWNGNEEILILATKVEASNNTTVLEILPLPSKPKVEKTKVESFYKLFEILNRKYRAMGGFGFAAQKGGGFEIVFQKRIGMHYLTVVHVSDPDDFSRWFRNFVTDRKMNASNVKIPASFTQIIGDYTSRGYNYFVIDLINVTTEQRTVDPTLYRFESDKLYYPLKITSSIKSDTRINLFLLANGIVMQEDLKRVRMWEIRNPSVYTFLSKSQLAEVNSQIAEILDGAYVVNAYYVGNTAHLVDDLEAYKLHIPGIHEHLAKLLEGTTIYLCLSAFSALNMGRFTLFASIMVFSPLLGFLAVFYILHRAIKSPKVEIRNAKIRKYLSYIVPALVTILTALLPGILAFMSIFILFFLGVVFALYIAVKVIFKPQK